MTEKTYKGAVLDERLGEEKAQDFKHEEAVASVSPVKWVEKGKTKWRKFPIYNQDGSGSCVAQTLKKMFGVMEWLKSGIFVHFSATDPYQRRWNKPNSGMAGWDVLNIARKGITLETLVPSTDMNDKQMDEAIVEDYNENIRKVFKAGSTMVLPEKDFDRVASTIQATGKAVMLWFYFEYGEWTDTPEVKKDIKLNGSSTCRHSVAGTDVFKYKGKQYILIEDSWGPTFGLEGRRLISRDFFEKRNFYVAHIMNFKYGEETPVPTPDPEPMQKFTRTMHFSPTFNVKEDVKELQKILKAEGLFPSNIDCTGYYGSITCRSVYKWQVKHKVASINELNSLGGHSCGPKTIKKLNELYG